LSPHTAIRSELVLDEPATALLDAVDADPYAPMTVGVQAPGGYGKSALLRELARIYRRAGQPVVDGWPEFGAPPEPGDVLLVDDAQLLDEFRLRELRRWLGSGPARLAVAYRPWPRPAALVELIELLNRDRIPVLLAPFTEQRTAARLGTIYGREPDPALVTFVQRQTGGVPRFVDRLAAALRPDPAPNGPTPGAGDPAADSFGPTPGAGGYPDSGSSSMLPRSAVLQFGAEVADLTVDVRRLLLAVAAGVALPVDLLGAVLGKDPDGVDETLAAARASGLLGPDDRLPPIVERAVTALSPATQRIAVWQRLAELQLGRGAPVLPLVRSLLTPGVGGECAALTIEAAAEEALADQPALAADLFAAAAAAGRPTAARQAFAAALAGDLDSALRLADRLVGAANSDDRRDGATVAATALAHRGQLSRGAELYRWSSTPSSAAFAAIGSIGTGQPAELDGLGQQPSRDGPPTLLTSAALLTARGVRETLGGSPTAALSTLVQAAALLEPAGRTVLLPDSPAALAALVALHSGELEIGTRVLDRAIHAGLGGALMSRRHRLLQAWILMVRGRTAAASETLRAIGPGTATNGGGARIGGGVDGPLESRDLLFASALEMGIARRNSDLPELQRAWGQAREALVRHPVDLFSFLPLGEITIAAARLGELGRLDPYLREAYALLDQLGGPALWATPLHWSGLHAAVIAEQPAVADEHVAALAANAGHSRYAAVVAAAAECWLEVLRGTIDPAKVEAAARGLHDTGLGWDGARLAGQAAIRTADRRAMTTLLDCARMLQGRPAGHKGAGQPADASTAPLADAVTTSSESRLSDREQEVADLVLAGLTYKQIGDRLFISAKTVEHHVARMRQRLNCANRSELLNRLRLLAANRTGSESVRSARPKRMPS
jgi:DNA-binding CsgD family transcriptional regulator